MANRTYLPTSHRLLSGYSALTSPRGSAGSGARASPPPDFAYDAYPRDSTRGSAGRDVAGGSGGYTRIPTSPGSSSAMSMAYSSVQDFPYGLSGVQMPTYNFGSELYNYVSNGFPRKSRMCTFCNKVFTRSTTRRYHERRCPLLRASSSLAKNEENNSASLNAIKEQQIQQRQKESPAGGRSGHHAAMSNSSLPRTLSSSMTNTTTSQPGVSLPQASPPLPSLHPAYPTFPKSSAVSSNPPRSTAYNYPHPYSAHFYNSISAAALASLDQNSNKQESDNVSWASSSSPPSSNKLQDQVSSFNSKLNSTLSGGGPLSLSKAFTPEAVMDLTARYCADFSLRSRPPVFPAPSLRAPPHSPPSPEPGETKGSYLEDRRDGQGHASPVEAMAAMPHSHGKIWSDSHQENKVSSYNSISSSSEHRRESSSPSSEIWHEKEITEPRSFMKVEPLDEEEEEEFEDEEDEDEMEEDEEQFKTESLDSEVTDGEVMSLSYRGTPYNPLVCQFCKKSFSDAITRKAHEALHSHKKLFACCLCSHSFHCAYSLRIHTLRHHKGGPYKCKYCYIDYELPSVLRSHLIKEHSLPKTEYQSLKNFSLLTNSTSSSPNSMLNTNAVSEGENEEYTKQNNFKHHRRSADHPPNQYNYSEETTKALLSPNNISEIPATNGKTGTEEETEVCKVCNKSFTKSYIRLHERAHADQKPYECPICNKRFGYKNNMKSHMKLHQGLKPYQCQICGARFTRGSTLRRHGRRHNISHSAMLDYVLYDQHGGRDAGLGQKVNLMPNSVSGVKGQYILPGQNTMPPPIPSADSQAAITSKHSAFGTMPSLIPAVNGLDTERFNGNMKRSPTHLSPPQSASGNSPRVTSSHYPSHSSLTNPMVGGLAAVAAANLFAYPNAAAVATPPHLYQFYASANPLMAYPPYSANQNVQSVQSNALNLSISKRKSPFETDDNGRRESKQSRTEKSPPVINLADYGTTDTKEIERIKEEPKSQEISESVNEKEKNPFTPNHVNNPSNHLDSTTEPDDICTKEQLLKVSTEDCGTQVNICCSSPHVQSSTGSVHQNSPNNSPVGSSSGPDGHLHSQTSPSVASQSSSPVNSAPSPTNPNDSSQDLLLSLQSSGKLFRCSFCDIYFTEYAMFRLHQKYHQCDLARPFLCAVCGEDCKDKTYFTVHLSEHLGLGPKPGLL